MINIAYMQESNLVTNQIIKALRKNSKEYAEEIVQDILRAYHFSENDLTDVDIKRINDCLKEI